MQFIKDQAIYDAIYDEVRDEIIKETALDVITRLARAFPNRSTEDLRNSEAYEIMLKSELDENLRNAVKTIMALIHK